MVIDEVKHGYRLGFTAKPDIMFLVDYDTPDSSEQAKEMALKLLEKVGKPIAP